jgi:hypothetical protein
MTSKSEKPSDLPNSLLAMPWGKLFFVTLACYLPAFLLVVVSYLVFGYAGSSQSSGEASLTELQRKQIAEEVKKYSETRIAEEVKKNLDSNSKEVDIALRNQVRTLLSG